MTETERKLQQSIADDLKTLLAVFPQEISDKLQELGNEEELIEIIMDLGRLPEARYLNNDQTLLNREVSEADIQHVVARVSQFTDDNRAGITRTLHRISAIRNRQGKVVGLTCRVGRAVYGTIDIIQDIVTSGKSLLLLGRPGVGKTTLLREAARVLADMGKRVVIVDTSNEIGGDGDIPHPSIGRARRMQVRRPIEQHEVMIEAVENHMPEVIIIDEIGREQEAEAARTIAERGVQLIGTAHGRTLSNLLLNPTLSDLVGGIESVTLSDEEARRRSTQKTVLERRSPPTFDVLIEIVDRQHLIVHHDVSQAVDAILRNHILRPETRYRDESGKIIIEKGETLKKDKSGLPQRTRYRGKGQQDMWPEQNAGPRPTRIFPYGVGQNRLRSAAQNLGVPIEIIDDLRRAAAVITLKNYYRKRPQPISEAEERGIPVYVLRSNTVHQMEALLADIFALKVDTADPVSLAINETMQGVERVIAGAPVVELSPQPARVRRMQHQLAREANLITHSYGREPNRRVRIYRE
jgi:stage III sporulation protein SpoIIIAA